MKTITIHPLALKSRPITPPLKILNYDIMPLVTTFITLPVLLVWAMIPVAGVVVMAAPASSDIAAVLGALFASGIAVLEAYHRKRDLSEKIKAFIGAAGVGSFFPGVLVNLGVLCGWYQQSVVEGIWWQAWAFMGLICGMNAWWIIHKISNRAKSHVEGLSDRKPSDYLAVEDSPARSEDAKP